MGCIVLFLYFGVFAFAKSFKWLLCFRFEFLTVEKQDLLECARLPLDCIFGSPYPDMRSEVRNFSDALKSGFDEVCDFLVPPTGFSAVTNLPVKPNSYGKKAKKNSAPTNCILNSLHINAGFEKKGENENFFKNLKGDFKGIFAKSLSKLHKKQTVRKSPKKGEQSSKKPSLVSFLKSAQFPDKLVLRVSSNEQCLTERANSHSQVSNTAKTQVCEQDEDVLMVYSQIEPYQLYSDLEPFRQIYVKTEPSWEVCKDTETSQCYTGSQTDHADCNATEHPLEVDHGSNNVRDTPNNTERLNPSRSRKRKRRENQRRGRLDEVPNAASSVNIDVSVSSLVHNPAFGIVCVDDNAHPIDASKEYGQCSLADPLCVNIKVEPDCPEEVSANTSAVRESNRILNSENVLQLQCEEAASLPPLAISPCVVPADVSFQSSVEPDPLQLYDIKISLERFEREIDAQIPDSQHHATSVSADFLQHVESPKLSTTAQHKKSQTRGATESVQESFACAKCSFKASNVIDLTKHLQRHQGEDSDRNTTQLQSSSSEGYLISASSVTSPLCTPATLPGKASVPLVVTLDDDSEPESMPSSNFPNNSSPSVPLQTSVRPTSLSNYNIPRALSPPRVTKTDKRHILPVHSAEKSHQQGSVTDILILSDLPGEGVTSSRPTSHSNVSVNPTPVPITDCSTNAANIPNPAVLHWPSQTAFSEEGTRSYSLPHSQGTTQYERSNLDSGRLKNRPINVGIGCKEMPITSQSHQPVACSINCSYESRLSPVGSLATTIQPSSTQLTENLLINKELQPPPKPQSQANVNRTPDGSVNETPTVLKQPSTEISRGLEPPPLGFQTFPLDRLEQCGSSEVLLNTCSSPLPSRQVLSTVPRNVSVIQQPPRKSSVNPSLPTQSSALLDPSHHSSALQSDGDLPNKASDRPVISRPVDPSNSCGISLLQQTTSSVLEPVCSTERLRGPSAVKSPTSSLLNHPVSKESVQVIDNLHGLSKESHEISRSLESPLSVLANYVQSLPLNQVTSASTVQAQSSGQPKAPAPKTSDNLPQLSILSRIDRLIEANAQVLDRTSIAPKRHPYIVPTSATSRILVGHLKSTNSTASSSRSTVSTPSLLSRNNASSGDVPHSEIDRADSTLLNVSADLGGGLQKPDGNRSMNISGPHNSVIPSKDKSTRSRYDLRCPSQKSQKTRSPSEKQGSSSDSDGSAMSDPDYFPPLRLDSDDDSDNSDGRNSVPSAFPENANRIPNVPLVAKPAANIGNKEGFGITKIVSIATIACPTIPLSTSGISMVAGAQTASKGEQVHLDRTLSSQKSTQVSNRDAFNISNNIRTSERAGLPYVSAARMNLSHDSTDPSISQSLQVSSAECPNAMRATNLPVAASTEDLGVSSVLPANTFSEAHLLMLSSNPEDTRAMPITSHGANRTAGTSVTAPPESASCVSSNSASMEADSSNCRIPRANDGSPLPDNSTEPLTLERLLHDSTKHVLGISSAATSKENCTRDVNSIPTDLEVINPNSSEEPQHTGSCEDVSDIILESTETIDSPHTTEQNQSTLSVFCTPVRIPVANATVESQPNRIPTIPDSVYSETSSIRSNDGAKIGNKPCTGVAGINSPQPQLAASRDNPKTPKQVTSPVIDIASDDSSTDVEDPHPERPRRKRCSSGGSSSESGDFSMVDPDYVPPSRDKLPLKTPNSVLDAIPTYEHWVRSKFIQDESDTDTPRPGNACCVCLRKFSSHESLKEHRAERNRDLRCCKCTFKAPTEKILKTHTNKHWKRKPYECEECNRSFSKRGIYVKHFLMHRNDFYYKCDVCDQGFNEYTPYEQHVNKHLNKTPYKCLKCDLAYGAKALLQDHKKRMHKRNAYSECTVCKKIINKFWLADHLKRHEQKEIKMYLCERCGKELKSKLSLSRHIIQHTGERPHMCNYCGATFKVPGALKKHERKHTGERPYKCEVCGKTFAFNTPYTYHLRTHTGERPYKCEFCGMTFAQPSPYAVHKRLHTGERPYKCKICDDAFPSHAGVRNHMQTHANCGNVQKRTGTSQGKASKPKKPRKRCSSTAVDDDASSSSDSEKESTEVDVQPRRSGRHTKCTKSLVEDGSDSGGNQE